MLHPCLKPFLEESGDSESDSDETKGEISELNSKSNSDSLKDENDRKDDFEPPLKKRKYSTTRSLSLLERLFPEQKSQVNVKK